MDGDAAPNEDRFVAPSGARCMQPLGTVYFVDDDDALRRALPRLLGGLGYEVRAFPSAAAFLEDYAAGSHECLLLDMRMPGASGMELLRTLRERGDALPIVFLTSHDDPSTRSRAMAAGASAFLAKPANEDALVGALERALKAKR